MKEDELLKLLSILKEEIHTNGLKIEGLRDDMNLISENTQGAHRRIDEIEARLDKSNFID